jgi:hypothetical protein
MLSSGSILEASKIIFARSLIQFVFFYCLSDILKEAGVKLLEIICIIELIGFGGRTKVSSNECPVHSLYQFDDNNYKETK